MLATKLESPIIVWVPERYFPDEIVWFDVLGVIVCAPWLSILPVILEPLTYAVLPLNISDDVAVASLVSTVSGTFTFAEAKDVTS